MLYYYIPYPPMTDFLSLPKAHMHLMPPGTVNLQKLHLEPKYLGRIPMP